MGNYIMKVIPKPKKGTPVLKVKRPIRGSGTDNYLCGVCQGIVCENVDKNQILGIIVICPNCGSYNKKGYN